MKDNKINLNIIIIGAIIVCIIGFISPMIVREYIVIEGLKVNEVSGWIGDIITPFFTFASIILVIATLFIQRQDLINQQSEIADSKEEIKKQNRTIELQRFENTFFNLLSFHNELLKSITREERVFIGNEEHFHEVNGKRALKYDYEIFKSKYNSNYIDYEFFDGSMKRDVERDVKRYVKEAYDEAYNEDIGQYFRSLYHIIKFIDTSSSINENEKNYYSSIVRAHLSDYELAFIYYNCISELGKEKFKEIIDKYDILKNLNKEILIHESHLWVFKIRQLSGCGIPQPPKNLI